MLEVSILIPLSDNSGSEFPESHHIAFEAFVLVRFGGVTRLPGTVQGKWMSESTTYVDSLIVYVIAVKSITDGAFVGEVVVFAKTHYAQEAIYIRYLGISEVL